MSDRSVRGASSSVGYLVRRFGQAVFVLWAAFTVSFLILYALPSDPVALMTGGQSNDFTPAQLDELRHEYGLDRPLFGQYVDQLGDALRGDLGRSLQSGRPVTTLIAESLPATAQITGIALLLAVIVGSTVAIVATTSRRRRLSQFLLGLPPLGVAIPSFWLGLLLLQQFSFHWQSCPALGNEGWRSLVLPAITLAIPDRGDDRPGAGEEPAHHAARAVHRHRPRQGRLAGAGADAPRPAQCVPARADDRRGRDRRPAVGVGGGGDGVLPHGPRPPHVGVGLRPGRPGRAGPRAVRRRGVRHRQPRRRPALPVARSADRAGGPRRASTSRRPRHEQRLGSRASRRRCQRRRDRAGHVHRRRRRDRLAVAQDRCRRAERSCAAPGSRWRSSGWR